MPRTCGHSLHWTCGHSLLATTQRHQHQQQRRALPASDMRTIPTLDMRARPARNDAAASAPAATTGTPCLGLSFRYVQSYFSSVHPHPAQCGMRMLSGRLSGRALGHAALRPRSALSTMAPTRQVLSGHGSPIRVQRPRCHSKIKSKENNNKNINSGDK